MTFEQATRFLQSHYMSDNLCADTIRNDAEHWDHLVMGNPTKFPNADLAFIVQFGEAATTYLALRS